MQGTAFISIRRPGAVSQDASGVPTEGTPTELFSGRVALLRRGALTHRREDGSDVEYNATALVPGREDVRAMLGAQLVRLDGVSEQGLVVGVNPQTRHLHVRLD